MCSTARGAGKAFMYPLKSYNHEIELATGPRFRGKLAIKLPFTKPIDHAIDAVFVIQEWDANILRYCAGTSVHSDHRRQCSHHGSHVVLSMFLDTKTSPENNSERTALQPRCNDKLSSIITLTVQI